MIDGDRLPTLRAERLRLRWLTEADLPSLHAIFSNAQVARYWSSPPFESLDEARAMWDDGRKGFEDKTLFQWGVALEENQQVIGTCTLAHVSAQNRRAEIGFALGRDHWCHGYMTEALDTLVAFAFDDLDLHRLEADVDPRNAASIRRLEGLGFQREGLLRERWQVGGEVQDAYFYGLLQREWRASERERTA